MPADLLKGIRVVELGQYIPAPFAALQLADLGADVVKIEPPAGDPMRHLGAARADGVSAAYAALNDGKRIVLADLKSAEGQAHAQALVAAADVLLESFRPGVLARLGLGRDDLARLNPRLIHCALSGYGQNGPLARAAGHDIGYMAAGGGLARLGTADRPVSGRLPISDYASGQQAALSIAAALLRRERTGQGCFIDIAMTDVMLSWQAADLAEASIAPPAARGEGSIDGGAAGYNIYRAACGGFIALGALEPAFWGNFCAAIGRADLVARHDDPLPQIQLVDELKALFLTRSALEWEERLGAADCCFQRLLETADIPAFPQFGARQMIRHRQDDTVAVSYPAWIDQAPAQERRLPWREVGLPEALARWAPLSEA
ncbi:CoA transferase [Azorhizobium oxalatiphilum]|uniref:CoA transferase n=1 Tax=Azorhizobium oxalatiphilum TaxID=980631 RepID=A0A917BW81_9HYPH|nr:CoA transferase [Azorhizobium oxalatiphilum]GGF58555.1 CoA transferase [Azorhizobium oxalatiphilum]